MHQSQRIAAVQAPLIPIVGELTKANPGTISLGQGVVRYAPPPAVANSIAKAVHEDASLYRYGLVSGIDPLLDRIRHKMQRDSAVTIDDQRRVVVTAGGNMAFLNALLAIADPGDDIIFNAPFYFNHEMAVSMANCVAKAVPTTADYQLDLEAIEAAIGPKTKAVVTISPNNPSGAVYPKEDLLQVNQLCAERGIYHIADEAYEYFVHEGEHCSPLSFATSTAHTIGCYSLSKSYGMAGWRIGYMVFPAHLEQAVKKIQDTNLICPPIACQHAACAALDAGPEWIAAQTAHLPAMRDSVLEALAALGDRISAPKPAGAFYVLIRMADEQNDMELVQQLITDFRVAVMPGSTFGAESCSLRIAYGALDPDTVATAMDRLVAGLEHLLD